MEKTCLSDYVVFDEDGVTSSYYNWKARGRIADERPPAAAVVGVTRRGAVWILAPREGQWVCLGKDLGTWQCEVVRVATEGEPTFTFAIAKVGHHVFVVKGCDLMATFRQFPGQCGDGSWGLEPDRAKGLRLFQEAQDDIAAARAAGSAPA